MDFDEYEYLPTSSTYIHMLAGAGAGIMEHCVMYPLDAVKTRMQSLQPNPHAVYKNVSEALYKMIRFEGILRPIRGMNAVIIGAGPAHALYFSCYEKMKYVFNKNERNSHSHLAHGAAGCFATVLHDAVMNPVEMVKQRMQMYNSPYKSCLDCIYQVWKVEGTKAFYRSYTTQLTMNVPFQSIHFMAYEFMQDATNHERTYNAKAHIISGAVAGAFAAAVTTPLDVCKTLLNTQDGRTFIVSKQSHINGLMEAVVTVYRISGLMGYFRGLQARIIYQMPSTAIAWSVYEFFKYILQKQQMQWHTSELHHSV